MNDESKNPQPCRRWRGHLPLVALLFFMVIAGVWWWEQNHRRDRWLMQVQPPQTHLQPLQTVRLADFPLNETSRVLHGILGTKADYLQIDREEDVPQILQASSNAPTYLVIVIGHRISEISTQQIEDAHPHAVIVFSQ